MTPTTRRRVATALLFPLLLQLMAPAVQAAPAKRSGKITRAVGRRIHAALLRILEGSAGVASRSDRIDLELTEELLDPHGRMRFRVEGSIRVPVKNSARRARLQAAAAAGESRLYTANGPVSYDLLLFPAEVEGTEVTFDVDFRLMIATDVVMQTLVRNGGGLLVGLGVGALASSAADALASFDIELAGGAIRLGVDELGPAFGGEAGAIAYAAFQDPVHHTWRERIKATLTARGLLRHFLISLVFLGGSQLVKGGVTTVGLAVAGLLLPGGGTFVVGLVATGVWMFLGHRLVKAITIKGPFFFRMARARRLFKLLPTASPPKVARLRRKIDKINQKILARFLRESEAAYKTYDLLHLLTGYFAKRVRDRKKPGSAKPPISLAPYKQLNDGVIQRMNHLARGEETWYAQRFLDQFLDAIGKPRPGSIQLPQG